MSLSDCPKCWDTPCFCGYGYRTWTKESRIELAGAVLGLSVTEAYEKLKDIVPKEHPKNKED